MWCDVTCREGVGLRYVLLYFTLLVEAHRALVGQLLGDGEAVGVPVAAAMKKMKEHTRREQRMLRKSVITVREDTQAQTIMRRDAGRGCNYTTGRVDGALSFVSKTLPSSTIQYLEEHDKEQLQSP